MSLQQIHKSSGTVMGGPWQIRHRTQAGISERLVAQTAYDALYEIECQMSHFKPESNLMQLNRTPVGEWLSVSAEMLKVLDTAQTLGQFTDGTVDITLGKAIDEWGFGVKEVTGNFQPKQLCEAHKHDEQSHSNVSYEIDLKTCQVRKNRDIYFNLSSIAKGFAVDYAAERVSELGIENFLIEAAGELTVQGKRATNMPWQVGLELPVPNQVLVYDKIAVTDISLATSGSYRKYREINGKNLSHTITPLNQYPIDSDLLSVSIFHEHCMHADALATALFVMGAARGSQFAKDNNIAALFLIKDPEGICEIQSECWKARINS